MSNITFSVASLAIMFVFVYGYLSVQVMKRFIRVEVDDDHQAEV